MTPHPHATTDDVLLDVGGICNYLGKSRETVRRWARARGLPLHRVTKNSAYARKSEIDEWLASHGLTPAETAVEPIVVGPPPRAQRIIVLPKRR